MLVMSHSKEANIALSRMSVFFEHKDTTGIGQLGRDKKSKQPQNSIRILL